MNTYIFDWDDNVVHMETKIHQEELVNGIWVSRSLSTKEFSKIRGNSNWRHKNNNFEESFVDFRDDGSKGSFAFLEDVKLAIANQCYGPVWNDFIECITNGCIFSIITARGHESSSIRLVIEWIIDSVLSKEQTQQMYKSLIDSPYLPYSNNLIQDYLDLCDFVGVSCPSKIKPNISTEEAKEIALLEFTNKINSLGKLLNLRVRVGFSDDDTKNITHMQKLLSRFDTEKHSNIIHFVIKNTNIPNNISKTTRTLNSIIDIEQ